MCFFKRLLVSLGALAFGFTALGFNGQEVTEGPLTLAIGHIPTVKHLNQSQAFTVSLTNSGATALTVRLEMVGLADQTRPAGQTRLSVSVPAGGQAESTFQFAMGDGSLSALYPVHVWGRFESGGLEREAHAVLIYETDFTSTTQQGSTARELPVVVLPAGGALPLASLKDWQIAWQWLCKPLERLPVRWQGSEPRSLANFARSPMARGGETRSSLQMHPPYQGGPGTIFAEYRLKLPEVTPIRFAFFNAIRDIGPTEPPSDGVTFRVWGDDRQVFERHTDAKTWQPGEADLTQFAGKEVLLRLECHPGPKNDTTCDSAFWGDPMIVVGAAPPVLSAAEKTQQLERARQAVASGPAGPSSFVIPLADGQRAAVVLGPNGFVDAALAFGNGTKVVAFDGINIALFDQPLGRWPSGAVVEKFETSQEDNRLRVRHRIHVNNETTELVAEVWAEQAGLRVKISGGLRITDLSLARADQKASRVYYGHGYCIVDPGAFRAGSGGHNLSTSHVGFDFENGVSLLTACDTPPDYFQVDGPQRIYALHTHPDTTFTFVPSAKGAFDCALKYRPLYDKKPSAGVAKKSGRLVFDLWGGRYAGNAALLRRCFDYGVTNSLVILHDWQRWGYDYRLPDIFPPSPSLGTIEELRELGGVCDQAGALWGLHDNYIDIYPDCDNYSYEHVTFTEDGNPRKAWLNEGRGAQAYQFRPDRVKPFLERNLKLIQPALKPSASFVDVWTSINAFDFYDRAGKFHSKMETLRCWGEDFALMRDTFGNNAPTTSEAGSDQLIGWLDGADCQFMMLSAKGGHFHNAVPCREWSRVPWFDVVNHARFSLHGVGYSSRYQGGLSRDLHGIESDDYLTAELLTGHALMMELPNMVRGATRKYWLAQDFIESIALDEITGVDHPDGDIHRLIVAWGPDGRVYVNRGESDWTIAGRTLPQYGYFAKNRGIESSIERLGGLIVEQSRGPRGFYVNGRGFNPDAPLAIEPAADRLEYTGGRNFRLAVNWQADQPASKDLSVFYHFNRPTPGRYTDTEFYGGGTPSTPTSRWSGRVTTDWQVSIPEGMPLGEYDVLVGLYDGESRRGRRVRLLGQEDANRRYRVGRLVVEGKLENGATNITAVRLVKPERPPAIDRRTLANSAPTDFRLARTAGAFRAVVSGNTLMVIPLPDGDDFALTLQLDQAFGRPARVKRVEVVDVQGKPLRAAEFRQTPETLTFTVAKKDFAYRVTVDGKEEARGRARANSMTETTKGTKGPHASAAVSPSVTSVP